jgi:hypothetical protein
MKAFDGIDDAKSDGMKTFVLEERKEMIWMEGTGNYIIL